MRCFQTQGELSYLEKDPRLNERGKLGEELTHISFAIPYEEIAIGRKVL
jgi:hypothetical protein